jgi:pimeloyl-CoA synthetase
MARKSRQLSNAFDKFTEKEQQEETMNISNDDVQEDVTVQNGSETSQEATGEPTEQSAGQMSLTLESVTEGVLNKYQERVKKPTVEETHVRTTFLLDKATAKRLDKLAKGKRGLKTLIMNDAIKALLDTLEKQK